MWLLSASDVASATEGQISTRQHHLWLMPLQQASEPQRSAWLGSAEGGEPTAVVALPGLRPCPHPRGARPKTQPFVGLSRLQGRPSERIPVCPRWRALRERSVNPQFVRRGERPLEHRGHCLGSPGSRWIGLLSPESLGSGAELAAALNAHPWAPRSLPLCTPPLHP